MSSVHSPRAWPPWSAPGIHGVVNKEQLSARSHAGSTMWTAPAGQGVPGTLEKLFEFGFPFIFNKCARENQILQVLMHRPDLCTHMQSQTGTLHVLSPCPLHLCTTSPLPSSAAAWCWVANQCFEQKVGIQESCRQTSLKCFLIFLCPVWPLYSLIINGSENLQVSAAGLLSCGAGVYFGVSSWLRNAFGNWWSWILIPTSRPSCIWMSSAPGECKLAGAGSALPCVQYQLRSNGRN